MPASEGVASPKYVLGLDLGSASIGWAAIRLDDQDDPCEVLAAGVRIFDPGVELPPAAPKMSTGDAVLRGLDRSKAVRRRIARQMRRQLARKRARQDALFNLLQDRRLLPVYREFDEEPLPAKKHHTFNCLDKVLSESLSGYQRGTGKMLEADQALPYFLRKEALERELSPFELGRVLYHLCQRRGYRPSAVDDSGEVENAGPTSEAPPKKRGRKAPATAEETGEAEKESPKKVEAGISDLSQKMQAAYAAGVIKAPLIGPYFGTFAVHNPHKERIRHRWTGREMFEREFVTIWATQSEFYLRSHPGLLTDELRTAVSQHLFYQRPLASTEHLIGVCDLEPSERRAPWASLEAQRFRMLQKVNNLKYFSRSDLVEKSLTEDKRRKLVNELEKEGDLSFAAIRKLLEMPGVEFNLQKPRSADEEKKKRHDEGKIEGNRVNKVMLEVFGSEPWNSFSWEEKVATVEIWRTTERFENRLRTAEERWQLDPDHARIWAEKRPPGDYCKLSRKAIMKLLNPEHGGMEMGVSYATARLKAYPPTVKEPLPNIPEVTGKNGFFPSLTNPAVIRALTELRKVVNAIIRKFGNVRPYEIRIELARELRKNRKQRQDAEAAVERNHQRRLKAAQAILNECVRYGYDPQGLNAEGLVSERRDHVTKMMLLMECGCRCPYTGDPISAQQLFKGEVEVEHIIPQSMMVDNSFDNLTLTFRSTNHEKLDKTPWMAFGGEGEEEKSRWMQILDRVQKFGNRRKLHLFQLRTPDEVRGFAARRLNDTRFTSKLAGRLLMSLYGGRDVPHDQTPDELDEFRDCAGRRAVFVSSGMVTSLLRDAWCINVNELIGEDAFKCPDKEEDDNAKRTSKKGNKKTRSDHRHHALDAVVIALTTEKLVHRINALAGQFYADQQDGSFRSITYRELMKAVRRRAWPESLDGEKREKVRDLFRAMYASYRPEHRLRGELHKANFFGKERGESKNGSTLRHQRVSIRELKQMKPDQIEKTIAAIVDGTVVDGKTGRIKQIVRQFGESLGGYRKWSEDKGYPLLPSKGRSPVPIRKFTIAINKNALQLNENRQQFGRGYPMRNVDEGEIAYISFFMVQERGRTKWKWDIVKLFDAAQRVGSLPKHLRCCTRISEKHPLFPNAVFRFSLMKGDLVELADGGRSGIFIVRRFEGDGRLWIAPANAAGKDEDLKNAGHLRRIGLSEFLSMGPGDDKVPQPVIVDLLGIPHRIVLGA